MEEIAKKELQQGDFGFAFDFVEDKENPVSDEDVETTAKILSARDLEREGLVEDYQDTTG